MFNNRILRNAEENLSEDWNTMVVYPLGQMDLFDILSSTYEVISFDDVLNKFTNVLEGVKLLQDNNLFYGDFSLENILLIDGVLKIADIGNIQEIYHGTDMKSIPYFYYSYIYPSIAALSYWFLPHDTVTGYKVTQIEQVKLSNKLLQKLYVDSIKKYGINEQINENIIY